MKKTLALALTSSLFIAGCASTGDDMKKEEMAKGPAMPAEVVQAKADLDAAIAAKSQWKLLDKSTGKDAVDLTKLLKVAQDKAAAGETDEAIRIAEKVSFAAKAGIDQANRYSGSKAMPKYD